MTHSIEITEVLQTEKDKIEDGEKVDRLIDIEERVDLYNLSITSCTIFKVNVWFRESNPDAYTPKMVSIGPYHKKNLQLGSMEKYKLLYLRRFLLRKESCLDVKNYMSELEKLKEEALKCYEEFGDNGKFCEMLLLDGCFVIEFIRECNQMYPKGEDMIININRSYIFRDLILLENQLPFFVLNKLYQMTKQDDDASLTILLVNYLFDFFGGITERGDASLREIESNSEKIKHLLHAVHIFSCHGIPMKKSNDDIMWHTVMPNATELSEAGVRFAIDDDCGTKLFDIKFKNGLMTIPYFRIDNDTETFLRNLISYEQHSSDEQHKYFSDYAIFMNHLINSDKDVALICEKGIIGKWFAGDDKEVVNLFKNLVQELTVRYTFYYKQEFRDANEYCEKTWNRIRATIIRNFFKKTWTGTSTVAGIIIFIVTIIQTILAFISTMKTFP